MRLFSVLITSLLLIAAHSLLLAQPEGFVDSSEAADRLTSDSLNDVVAPAALPLEALPIVVKGRTVAHVRVPVGDDPPAQRVIATTERIKKILDTDLGGDVQVTTMFGGKALTVDGRLAVFFASGDVDSTMGESMEQSVASAKKTLELLISESRELETVGSWIWTAGIAGIAFVVFVIVLRIVWWGRKRLTAIIVSRVDSSVKQSSYTFRQILRGSTSIPVVLSRVVALLSWIFTALLAYTWLTFTLKLFPFTRAGGEQMSDYIFSLLNWFATGILNAVPGLVVVAVIFILARSLNKFLASTLNRIEKGTLHITWIDRESVRPTRQILRVVIWLFALAFAYPYIPGSSSDAFKGVSVVAGLMLSLGASSSVGQALSGLVLMYSRTIRVGEFVRIGDHAGTVTRIGFFQTWLRTPFHEEISMPSSAIANATVVNYTRLLQDGISFSTTMTIGYDVPWRLVHDVLNEASARTENVAAQPPPIVTQGALQDYYVEYRLTVVFSDPAQRHTTITSLLGTIQDVCNENGIQIMSPHYVNDPSTAKTVQPQDQDPGLKGNA